MIPGRAKRHRCPIEKVHFYSQRKLPLSLVPLQAQADDGYEATLQKFVVKANIVSLLSFIKANVADL